MTTATTITSAAEWADALDADMGGRSLSDYISIGYADGTLAGVPIAYWDERADDARGTVVSADGRWVVRYLPRSNWWTVVEAGE